jgi:hypothetical protein
MKGSGSIQIMTDPDSGGPKTFESYGFGSKALLYRTRTDRCGFETVPKDSYTSTILNFFLLVDGRIRIRPYNNDGSGWPKNIRIRIHNTAL